MADMPPPNPSPVSSGAVQPPKKETGKVQPKKETVRINLPPKPSAAPTIKLPTLPPGGPTGAPATPVPPSAAAPAALAMARPTAAAPTAATTSVAKPAGTSPARPVAAAAPSAPTIKGLDKVLIYAAAVLAIAAVGLVFWGWYTLNGSVTTFNS